MTISPSSSIATNRESELSVDSPALVGQTFLSHIWYVAIASEHLRQSQMVRKVIAGEQILVARAKTGSVFAMRDACPHQAVPLTAGEFDGTEVKCRFHGWKFNTEGVCTVVPSLCTDQKLNLCSIKARSYPCRESQGLVWVYLGEQVANPPEIPRISALDEYRYDQTTITLQLPTHIDLNVLALIDTAHVPYVHTSWWWRNSKNLKEKAKQYVPSGTGWTMLRHKPSKHSIGFKLIGDWIETEISFHLPGIRQEVISVNGVPRMCGFTTLTPVDEHHTEMNHTTYWTVAGVKPLLKPLIHHFATIFLSQDRDMALLQRECFQHNTGPLIWTIKDAGTPGRWYFDLKREWMQASHEGRPFKNPIKPSTLRWKT